MQSYETIPPRVQSGGITSVQVESPYPYTMQQHIYDKSRPENLYFLACLKALMDEFPGTMTLGEIGDDHPFQLAYDYTKDGKPLNTAYNTHMMSGNIGKTLTQDVISFPVKAFQSLGNDSWPSWAFSNHDVVRTVSRWGGSHAGNPELAKMLLALLCCLRGTIFMYQGEELGLTEADIPFEKVRDPWGLTLWPEWKGRDGCRTPMPWYSNQPHAGFSSCTENTWLPIPDVHTRMAVDVQEIDLKSPLHFTRKFLAWRKTQPVLVHGDINFIDLDDDMIIVFERVLDRASILCAFNLGAEDKIVTLPSGVQLELVPFGFYCEGFDE